MLTMSALVRVQRHGISMCYWRKLSIALSEGRLYRYLKCTLMIWASPVAQTEKNPPARDAGSIPGSGRSKRRGRLPTLVFLPEEFHGQRSLVRYSQKDCKESDTTEQLTLYCNLIIKMS